MPDHVNVLPFEEVYRRFAGNVYRFCLSQLRDPAEAEDVAADVFVAAFTAYEKAQPDADHVLFWLMRIARNRAIDHRRRSQRLVRILGRLRHAEPGRDPEAVAEMNMDAAQVLEVMSELSSRDRLLLGLRYAADLPFTEVARLAGLTPAAAAVATSRAVERLRQRAGDLL